MLQAVGFRRHETLQLMKKQPSVFRTGADDIQLVVSFLRYYCGFKKVGRQGYEITYSLNVNQLIANFSCILNQLLLYTSIVYFIFILNLF